MTNHRLPTYLTEDGYPVCSYHLQELLDEDPEYGYSIIQRTLENAQRYAEAGCFFCNEEYGPQPTHETLGT